MCSPLLRYGQGLLIGPIRRDVMTMCEVQSAAFSMAGAPVANAPIATVAASSLLPPIQPHRHRSLPSLLANAHCNPVVLAPSLATLLLPPRRRPLNLPSIIYARRPNGAAHHRTHHRRRQKAPCLLWLQARR